jgi:predicted nucleotidyltransferase
MEIRTTLLSAVLTFVQNASLLNGITRIAVIGSITTPKTNPKDVDLLVSITDEMDLTPLATLGRKLLGKTQAINHGTDVFLADQNHEYLGRICLWKTCAPGIRQSCDAQHCGLRAYLHDDLQAIQLKRSVIVEPPIELWPKEIVRVLVPEDIEIFLLNPLRAIRK